MFWPILRFELAYHLKRPITYLYLAVLFLLHFFLIASDAVMAGGPLGLVRKNSPYALAQSTAILTAIGQVITTAIVGTALLRDFHLRSHELVFTTRISRLGYLGGRFGGALCAMLVAYAGIPLGALVGSLMPWVDAEKLLPINVWWYVQPFLLFGVTNVLIVGALFVAVGALTRNLLAIYIQGIVLLLLWSVSQEWLGGLDRDALANALDIFGITSLQLTTRYWTVAERNSQLVELTGMLLVNRLIWLGIAAAALTATLAFFKLEAQPPGLFSRRRAERARRRAASTAARVPGSPAPVHVPAHAAPSTPRPSFTPALAWQQMLSTTSFSFRRIVRDRAFLAIAGIGLVNAAINAWYADQLYGVTTWPLTYLVGEMVGASFFLFMIILTTIYAGESVWRERSVGADQLVDASPVPVWATSVGKVAGVVAALTIVLAVLAIAGMGVQVAKGYYNFEVGVYARFLFGTQLPWVVAITLFAFLVHALVDSKFIGHIIVITYWIGSTVALQLGIEHQLLQPASPPGFTYSDMNGFGHFVGYLFLSAGYSVALGSMGLVVAVLAWARGTEHRLPARLAQARRRWGRGPALAVATSAALVLVFGGMIFYNTNVLNDYESSKTRRALRADWERTYKPLSHLAPPRITDIDVTAELWPERRAYVLDGRYVMVNREDAPIDSILVVYERGLHAEAMEWSRAADAAVVDSVMATQLWVLRAPLQPGDSLVLRYRLSYGARGFPNSAPNNRIVANGTFLPSLGPSLGYNDGLELSDPDERRKQKLPPRDRLPDLDDPAGRRNSQFSIDADRVTFAVTIATAPDQIALAPGTLIREWEQEGRRWFRFEAEQPIANMATAVSARYEVRRDRWRDVDISVYYHPGHEFNIDAMIASVKASLEYFTEQFGPYQHREVRILEFPRYSTFAQAFPATIPYSEAIGFIMRVRERDDDLDMPYFVTAHEVAHQWWGHQVTGARVQGSALIVESMAEYAALVVMERRYGRSHAQKFLRHELDRYLQGRSGERIREQPLIRTEHQAYIHYNKGALALYALRDYIGEDAMNRALRGYLEAHRWEEAPYSTAREFVAFLRAETPDSLAYVIEDLFETITLHDNRTDAATWTELPDGRFAVNLSVASRKVRADSVGNETEIPLADYIDIGVFGEPEPGNALGVPLYLAKHHITAATSEIEVIVEQRPRRAGIDPYNKLIDRVPGDNVRAVTRAGASP